MRYCSATIALAGTMLTSGVVFAGEAPMLAEKVAEGSLPPLEERLPENPRVLEPLEGIGEYGGTWRTGLRESAPTWNLRTVGYDNMTHWTPD